MKPQNRPVSRSCECLCGFAVRMCLRAAATVFLMALATRPASAVPNFCPLEFLTGPCVVTHPLYVNLYWDTSPAQWDADVKAGPFMTQARIDAVSLAIVNSGYFGPLSQYQVTSVKMAPSVTSACVPVPTSMDVIESQVLGFINCALGGTLLPEIVNVLLPPQTSGGNWCTQRSANHKNYGAFALIALLPTNSACNPTFSNLMYSMTHEMVEAATDPSPNALSGYKISFDGELADLCESHALIPFLIPPISSASNYGQVASYWSNSANGCIDPLPTTAPTTPNIAVCGTGQNMQITLTGTFGAAPWDLVANRFNGQTMYLQASIASSQTWSAGNVLDVPAPDTVGLGRFGVSWQPGTIGFSGFSGSYGTSGQIVRPGDKITVSVFSVQSGQPASATVSAPLPANVFLGYQGITVPAGTSGPVIGAVLDSSNLVSCAIGGVPVTLTVSAGTVTQPTTGADGSFTASYHAPDVAGNVTLTATATPATSHGIIAVTPVLTSLSTSVGTVMGGQTITITGDGFDAGATQVTFQGFDTHGNMVIRSAPILNIPDHQHVTLVTPATPFSGDGVGAASVLATVHGVTGGSLPYQYIVPGKPFATIAGNLCETPAPYTVTVTVYNADGSTDDVQVGLSSTAPIFDVGNQRTFSETVESGASFQISGDAPYTITATDEANSVSAQFTFECHLILPGPGEVPVSFTMPTCNGDCGGPLSNIAVWTFGEASAINGVVATGANWVTMMGRPAKELQGAYTVQSMGAVLFAQLLNASPRVVVEGGRTESATFLSLPIVIGLSQRAGAVERIRDSAHVSFVPPAGVYRNYQVVHFESAGGTWAWTAVKGARYLPNEGVVHAPAAETGIYALVALGSK